jgi:hypothetical protein
VGHWHVGYYEGDYCIEAVGFENEEGTWTVFFNELDDEDIPKLFDFLHFFKYRESNVFAKLLRQLFCFSS